MLPDFTDIFANKGKRLYTNSPRCGWPGIIALSGHTYDDKYFDENYYTAFQHTSRTMSKLNDSSSGDGCDIKSSGSSSDGGSGGSCSSSSSSGNTTTSSSGDIVGVGSNSSGCSSSSSGVSGGVSSSEMYCTRLKKRKVNQIESCDYP